MRRAVNKARQDRLAELFTWTARNQPVRMICATARARHCGPSVLFGMALHGRLGLAGLDADGG
jgi:hypothetical protein